MSMMTWKEAQKEKFHGMQSVQQQERVMIWRLYLVYAKKKKNSWLATTLHDMKLWHSDQVTRYISRMSYSSNSGTIMQQ